MTYDIEREKQATAEIRKAMAECFPLANENDLPWAPSQIKAFLRDRIKREVDEGIFHFQARVTRVLCEVSPPKSHVEDMARICVEQAKEMPRLKEALKVVQEREHKWRQRIGWLTAKLRELPKESLDQLGFGENFTELGSAIDGAAKKE